VGMNEIFLSRGSDNKISSQRVFMFDLRALPRLSRVTYLQPKLSGK